MPHPSLYPTANDFISAYENAPVSQRHRMQEDAFRLIKGVNLNALNAIDQLYAVLPLVACHQDDNSIVQQLVEVFIEAINKPNLQNPSYLLALLTVCRLGNSRSLTHTQWHQMLTKIFPHIMDLLPTDPDDTHKLHYLAGLAGVLDNMVELAVEGIDKTHKTALLNQLQTLQANQADSVTFMAWYAEQALLHIKSGQSRHARNAERVRRLANIASNLALTANFVLSAVEAPPLMAIQAGRMAKTTRDIYEDLHNVVHIKPAASGAYVHVKHFLVLLLTLAHGHSTDDAADVWQTLSDTLFQLQAQADSYLPHLLEQLGDNLLTREQPLGQHPHAQPFLDKCKDYYNCNCNKPIRQIAILRLLYRLRSAYPPEDRWCLAITETLNACHTTQTLATDERTTVRNIAQADVRVMRWRRHGGMTDDTLNVWWYNWTADYQQAHARYHTALFHSVSRWLVYVAPSTVIVSETEVRNAIAMRERPLYDRILQSYRYAKQTQWQFPTTEATQMAWDDLQLSHLRLGKLYAAFQQQQAQQALTVFIEPNVQLGTQANGEPASLTQRLQQWVAALPSRHHATPPTDDDAAGPAQPVTRQPPHRVHLLFGESGAGKTSSLLWLRQQCWEHHRDTVIPVFIPLTTIPKADLNADFISVHFSRMGYTVDQIAQLRAHYTFAFFLDGYDELIFRDGVRNIVQQGQLRQWQGFTLITCRTLLENDCFTLAADKHYTISPFDDNQIETYVDKQCQQNLTIASTVDLRESSLWPLMHNPLLLYLIIDSFSILQPTLQTGASITHYQVYAAFTEKWFHREFVRIIDNGALPSVRGPTRQRWQIQLLRYAECIAWHMHRTRDMTVSAAVLDDTEAEQLRNILHDPNPDKHVWLLRNTCPLKSVGDDRYQFIHPSFHEFLVAKQLNEHLCLVEYYTLVDNTLRYQAYTNEQFQQQLGLLPTSPWNHTILKDSPAVLDFLRDLAPCQYRLLPLITASNGQAFQAFQTDDSGQLQWADNTKGIPDYQTVQYAHNEHGHSPIAQVAGNALTLLVHCGYSADGLNLSHTRIVNADISQGRFNHVMAQQVNWQQILAMETQLCHANFLGSYIGLQFGELPYLQPPEDYGWLYRIAICPSEPNKIAAGYARGNIVIWHLTTNTIDCQWQAGKTGMIHLAYTPNGDKLCSHTWRDDSIKLWDVTTGQKLQQFELPDPQAEISCLVTTKNSLIAGSANGTLHRWDVATGQHLSAWIGHTGRIWCLCIINDTLISGGKDSLLRQWDLASNHCIRIFAGHSADVRCVTYTDTHLISGSEDKTLRIWDLASGACINTLKDHRDRVVSVAKINNILISLGFDNVLRLWELPTYHCIRTWKGNFLIGAISVTNDVIYAASIGQIRRWKLHLPHQSHYIANYRAKIKNTALLRTIPCSIDSDGNVHLWVGNKSPGYSNKKPPNLRKEVIFTTSCMAVMSDWLITGYDNYLIARNLFTQQTRTYSTTLHEKIRSIVTFTERPEKFITISEINTIRLWDITTNECQQLFYSFNKESLFYRLHRVQLDNFMTMHNKNDFELPHIGHEDEYSAKLIYEDVTCVTLTASFLISSHREGKLRQWDLNTSQCIREWNDHTDDIIYLLSHEGRLITGGSKGNIHIWELTNNSYQLTRRLTDPSKVRISYLCIHPGCQHWLWSVNYWGHLIAWDLCIGERLDYRYLPAHLSVGISKDGTQIAVSDSDTIYHGKLIAPYTQQALLPIPPWQWQHQWGPGDGLAVRGITISDCTFTDPNTQNVLEQRRGMN
tara:strand:- start:21867 stop:27167 length:5301 start_codon:yes stop_codon:yes gene_type:complete